MLFVFNCYTNDSLWKFQDKSQDKKKLGESCFYPLTSNLDYFILQYLKLKQPMDGGAWWAAVHGVAKSQTRLSDFTFIFYFHALEKEMATHSSVLAWRIPETEEPGGLPSMGSHRVGYNWSDLAAAAAAACTITTTAWVDWVWWWCNEWTPGQGSPDSSLYLSIDTFESSWPSYIFA